MEAHVLLGVIKLPWESGVSLLCTATYGDSGSRYHCNERNTYYALDFDRPWTGSIEPETKILSIANGVISALDENLDAFGNCLRIRHTSRVESLYAHLRFFSDKLYVGKGIQQGEFLGLLGETGTPYGPHLHFQLLIDSQCLGELSAARPEPMSHYSSFTKDRWYQSDNKLKKER